MTITYAIANVSSNSTESVTTLVADKSDMVFQGTSIDPKTGRITATYALATGDVNHAASVTVSVDPQSSGARPRYGAVTFKTWASQTNDITGEVDWWPVQATMSFVIQSDAPIQLADFNKLMAAVFSYTYLSVTSGTRDTTWLQKLLYGSPVLK